MQKQVFIQLNLLFSRGLQGAKRSKEGKGSSMVKEKNNKSLLTFPTNNLNRKNTLILWLKQSKKNLWMKEEEVVGAEKNYLNDIRT